MNIAIIGAGASGLAAAITAAQMGARVTVYEGSRKAGRKILASGNGRCNLMNAGPLQYYGGKAFAEGIFQDNPGVLTGFFEHIGLETHQEEGGRVYPACGRASVVRDVLMAECERLQVRILYEAYVNKVSPSKNKYTLYTGQEQYTADRVILCAGGMAGRNLGHDGSAYTLYGAFGHRVVPPRPALTGICTDKKTVAGLDGMRCPVRLTLKANNRMVDTARGEVLFTEYGLSGVCVMQLSRTAGEQLERHPVIYIDFAPMLGLKERKYDHGAKDGDGLTDSYDDIAALLKKRRQFLPENRLLMGLLPAELEKKLQNVPFDILPEMLSAYPVPVKGVRGFDQAQVTSGGLDIADFDEKTLESRLQKGLYASGEVLDVDGDCGGFNLQWAFLSGIVAGKNAARS